MPNPKLNADELVAVGVISSTHGVRGQVKIRSFTDFPEDILAYGPLYDKTGARRFDIRLDGNSKGGLIASIKGISNCNDAEKLKGTELFANRANLPEPDEGEFYYEQLIGLEVRTEDGAMFGSVRAIQNYGASDLLEVRVSATGKNELFTFTDAVFPEVDIDGGSITIRPPEVLEAKGNKDD